MKIVTMKIVTSLIAAALFLCANLAAGLIAVALCANLAAAEASDYTLSTNLFSVRCSRCGTEFIRPALTNVITQTDEAAGGTYVHRTLTMKCPKCLVQFEAKNKTFVPDVVATAVASTMPRLLPPSIIPVKLTNPQSGLYVLTTTSAYDLKLVPMNALSPTALIDFYNTNRSRMWVVIVEAKFEEQK